MLQFQTFIAKHSGVHFSSGGESGVQFSSGGEEDIILAGLVYHFCTYPQLDVSNVRVNITEFSQQLMAFVTGESTTLTIQYSEIPFCKTVDETVDVYCLCRTPWIEGTTSLAIYGSKKQKNFNMHMCCKCEQWFHKYCLSLCHLQLPKRNQDYVCPGCKNPKTIPWIHPNYTNTCTSDNILTILLVYCQQYRDFLKSFNSNEAEDSLKSAMKVMLNGNIVQGKTVMLDYIRSRYPLKHIGGTMYDCFGSEYEMFLRAFRHVHMLSTSKQCNFQLSTIKYMYSPLPTTSP